jgi:hypothetical protein
MQPFLIAMCVFAYLSLSPVGFFAVSDNSTLANLLPGIVDGALDLVLTTQGPDRPSRRKDDKAILENLPGQFELLYDENTKFEYK